MFKKLQCTSYSHTTVIVQASEKLPYALGTLQILQASSKRRNLYFQSKSSASSANVLLTSGLQLSVSLYCAVEGSLRRMRQSALSADLDQVPARADPASHEETTSQIKHCRDEKLSPVFPRPWLYGLIIFLLFRQNIPEGDTFKSVFHYGGQLGIDISVSDCSSNG